MTLKGRPPAKKGIPITEIVSVDALALVRFGLRAPDDPRIVDTVKVIDAVLKVETPRGPSWHRYNGDGYGEKADGSPYDGKRRRDRPGLAALDRRARPTTSWRRAAATRRSGCCTPWNRSPATAG